MLLLATTTAVRQGTVQATQPTASATGTATPEGTAVPIPSLYAQTVRKRRAVGSGDGGGDGLGGGEECV